MIHAFPSLALPRSGVQGIPHMYGGALSPAAPSSPSAFPLDIFG